MEEEAKMMQRAEKMEFPPIPDDEVWCSIRGQLVGVNECATDACVAPEMRPVCWMGHDRAARSRQLLVEE